MLERAASSLEKCALHRMLYTHARAGRSCRKLPPNFWLYGAAALELCAARDAIQERRAELSPKLSTVLRSRPTSAAPRRYDALESLYSSPFGAASRRYSSSPLDTPDRWLQSPSLLHSRSITSLRPLRLPESSQPPFEGDTPQNSTHTAENPPTESTDTSQLETTDSVTLDSASPPEPEATVPAATTPTATAPEATAPEATATPLETLRQLLDEARSKASDEVWRLYNGLSEVERNDVQIGVLEYLTLPTGSTTDAERAKEIIAGLDRLSFDELLFLLAVRAALKTNSHEEALSLFRDCAQRYPSATVCEELLGAGIDSASWPLFRDAWFTWRTYRSEILDEEAVKRLSTDLRLDQMLAFGPEVREEERKIQELHGTGDSKGDEEATTEFYNFKAFLYSLVSDALFRRCPPRLALDIVRVFSLPPNLVADYIVDSVERDEKVHIPRMFTLYRAIVRSRSVEIDPRVFEAMFEVFYPLERGQLLDLHTAFCNQHYEKKVKGKDVLRIWWTNYVSRAAFLSRIHDPISFKPYIDVFAAHDDQVMVQYAQADVAAKLGVLVTYLPWYERLQMFCADGDYKGAMKEWTARHGMGRPDVHTVTTAMQLAATKGDVPFTLEMFEELKAYDLHRSAAVLRPIMEAYGKNSLLEQASKLCYWAMGKGIRDPGLYNSMARIYASHHRLYEAHQLLNAMAQKGMAWDHDTFSQLLKALGRALQVVKAQQLLREAIEHSFWRVTTQHYETVMAAALTTNQFGLVHSLGRQINEQGLTMSLNAMSLLVKAGHRWRMFFEKMNKPVVLPANRVSGEDLVQFYRQGLRIAKRRHHGAISPAVEAEKLSRHKGEPPAVKPRDTISVKRVAFTLAEIRDRNSLMQLAALYLQRPVYKVSEWDLPDGFITAFMVLESASGDYEAVKHLWNIIWERNLQISREAAALASKKGTPRMPAEAKYNVDEAFRSIQQVLTDEGDADGLMQLLQEVASAGFQLGRRNWNHVTQALVKMGRLKEGATINERMLMPQWRGWQHMRKLKVSQIRQKAQRKRQRRLLKEEPERQGQDQDGLEIEGAELAKLAKQYGRRQQQQATQPSQSQDSAAGGLLWRQMAKPPPPPFGARRYTTLTRRLASDTATPQPPTTPRGDRPPPVDESYPHLNWQSRYPSVAAFLKNRYNKRRRIRWQRRRKTLGQSVRLAPRLLNPGRHPWYLRPNAHTLRALGRGFIEARKMMRFSRPADEAFRYIKTFCPKTAKAANNLRFSDDPEVRAWFSGDANPAHILEPQSWQQSDHLDDRGSWENGFWQTGSEERKKKRQKKGQKGASTSVKEGIHWLFKVEGPDRMREKRWRKRRRYEARLLERERLKEEKERELRELQELVELYGEEVMEAQKRAESAFDQHFEAAVDPLKLPKVSREETEREESDKDAFDEHFDSAVDLGFKRRRKTSEEE